VVYNYQFGVAGEPDRGKLRPNTLVIGLKIERDELNEIISKRVDAMLNAGLEGEAKVLAYSYGWDSEALRGVGYAQWKGYFESDQTLAETRNQIIRATKDLAKRQRTWFRRNKSIHWFETPVKRREIVDLVTTFLDKPAS
jgi:tRNA dimethylallyltransferase